LDPVEVVGHISQLQSGRYPDDALNTSVKL
jgi:hypothetical protein